MEYLPHIFYDTSDISKNQIRKLFKEAKELSFNWWVDDLPTWSRRKIEWPFEKAIRLFDRTTRKNLHISVVHRRWGKEDEHYLELGYCTLNRKGKNGDIFLWIKVSLEHKDYLVNKYTLNEKL
jgi:hypothetical protein